LVVWLINEVDGEWLQKSLHSVLLAQITKRKQFVVVFEVIPTTFLNYLNMEAVVFSWADGHPLPLVS
jgi:hypothetical protein